MAGLPRPRRLFAEGPGSPTSSSSREARLSGLIGGPARRSAGVLEAWARLLHAWRFRRSGMPEPWAGWRTVMLRKPAHAMLNIAAGKGTLRPPSTPSIPRRCRASGRVAPVSALRTESRSRAAPGSGHETQMTREVWIPSGAIGIESGQRGGVPVPLGWPSRGRVSRGVGMDDAGRRIPQGISRTASGG